MERVTREKIIVTAWACGFLAFLIDCIVPHHSSVNAKSPAVIERDTTVCVQEEQPAPCCKEVRNVSTSTPKQQTPKLHLVSYNGRYFRYSSAFSDRNDLHLSAAQHIGLKCGPENRTAAAKMKDKLREVQTNDWYVVEELTHSVPYLVPIAANRLDSIGAEFADILKRNGLPHYRFRVTSVLRSQEDIRRLQRSGNHNSISNSAHNYGTTFDIGYWHYDKVTQTCDSMTDDNLKLVLAQTLLNQQRAGHIYVKYECKQSCFHITARN